MKRIVLFLGVLLLVGAGCASGADGEPVDDALVSKKQPAPEFSLEDYDGNTVSLSDFEGKPVIINSWATWCPFCLKELGDFAIIQAQYPEDVVFIAISRAQSLNTSKDFTDKIGISERMTFLLDPYDSFYKSIGGFAMPETIFVDKGGNIVAHKRGPMEIKEIETRTKELIAK